jgi:hypothetical protein
VARVIGALLGLLLGVGLLLIWRSGPRAPQRRDRTRKPSRRQQQLAAAGLTGINAAQLTALQAGLGLLTTVVVLLTTGTVTVSLLFGAFAAARRGHRPGGGGGAVSELASSPWAEQVHRTRPTSASEEGA